MLRLTSSLPQVSWEADLGTSAAAPRDVVERIHFGALEEYAGMPWDPNLAAMLAQWEVTHR